MNDKGMKLAGFYISDEAHAAISAYAETTGQSITKVCKNALEELEPVFVEMVKALQDIKQGKDKQAVLEKYLENTIEIAKKDLDND